MNTINALGFIEVYGLVAGIEAADAMLKSAKVRLLRQFEVHPAMITVVIEGDLAACRAAVAAGVAAASRVGRVISSNVMGRPDEDTEIMVQGLIPRPSADSVLHANPRPKRRESAGQAKAKAARQAVGRKQ